jgi:Spy/CpxP family protein refolding chaperone
MREKKVLMLVAVAIFVFAFSSQSLAFWGPAKKVNKPRQEGMARIVKELNLTPKQKEQFMSRRKEMDKALKEYRKDIDKHARNLKEEMRKDRPDKRSIYNNVRKIGDIRVKMQLKRVDSLLELRESLSKEQRIKFRKMLELRGLNRKISCEKNKFNVKLRIRG